METKVRCSCPINGLLLTALFYSDNEYAYGGMGVAVLKKLLPLGIRLYYHANQTEWSSVLRIAGLQESIEITGPGGDANSTYFRADPHESGSDKYWSFEPNAQRAWVGVPPFPEDRAKLAAFIASHPTFESPQEVFLDVAIWKTIVPMQQGQCRWE